MIGACARRGHLRLGVGALPNRAKQERSFTDLCLRFRPFEVSVKPGLTQRETTEFGNLPHGERMLLASAVILRARRRVVCYPGTSNGPKRSR